MNRKPLFHSTFGYDHDDVVRTEHVTVRMSKRDIAHLRKSRPARVAIIQSLRDSGHLAEYGCDCSHCNSGWDCCGRFTLSSIDLVRVHRGLKFVSAFYRNV